MEIKKQLKCNYHDIELAIREAVIPMQHNIDEKYGIPYFINIVRDGKFENHHHKSYSAAHVPGRWLNALFGAQCALGIEIDEAAVRTLANCTYDIFDEKIGLPRCLDLETMKPEMLSDLHNLREYMHALYTLIRFRSDSRAYDIALKVMDTVDKYFDYENNIWDGERFTRDTGCKTYIAPIKGHDEKTYYFPLSFGRYIEPLVKLYQYCGMKKALVQALKLRDCAFKNVLDESGKYDPVILGGHTHSMTSMISSLALLSKVTNDKYTMLKILPFINNGLKEITLDFGWCLENYYRQDLGGEANNTSDILRTYLLLGESYNKEFYNKSERIMRGHLLPSQLLDEDIVGEWKVTGTGAPVMKGTFGFSGPFGHEHTLGRMLCYNWDIVGGAIDGLCEALKHIAVKKDNILDVNMLFNHDDENISISDPYVNDGLMKIIKKTEDNSMVRVNLSDNVEISSISGIDSSKLKVRPNQLYLFDDFKEANIKLNMKKSEYITYFRGKLLKFRMAGDMITHAASGDFNQCYFEQF